MRHNEETPTAMYDRGVAAARKYLVLRGFPGIWEGIRTVGVVEEGWSVDRR